ncbi:MAG: triphosphoribosyl-dephospho-CoA synthase [Thermovirgaceae bacterium]|nr:triphosphoribosyl-dephospho-CoA synthase [Synergistales bacterium]HPC76278.1 triphosphoribosyl-dephospho-CoA synthase [Synergistales bacterium]HRU91124.1 triphosphoribosyl-dephospho-CoA synthase [Thermovirgaceae bacterium]
MNVHVVLGALAASAAAAEVFIAPKPGLVDRFGPGSHRDMDFNAFLLSLMALAPFWQRQALSGLAGVPPGEALPCLRRTGLKMDAAMYRATSGVNTHKGLIFALSLLLYGAGRCLLLGEGLRPSKVAAAAASAARGCCERELLSLAKSPPSRPLTGGERIFLEHGVTGIRGEVEGGFPTVLRHGLPSFRKALSRGATRHDSALYTLFDLMMHGEDTNVIARKGHSFWRGDYRRLVGGLLDLGTPPYDDAALASLKEADEQFRLQDISPGGAADLLTCTLFLHDCDTLLVDIVNIQSARYNICNITYGGAGHEPGTEDQDPSQVEGAHPEKTL